MQIVEQTPTTLKLRTTALEWAIWLILMGIGLCVIGAVQANGLVGAVIFWPFGIMIIIAGVSFVERATVFAFDLTIDRLSIQKRYLVRSSETRYPLHNIQAVTTEWLEDSDGDRYLVIALDKPIGRPIYIQDIVQIRNEAEYESIAALIRRFLNVGERSPGT